MKKNICIFDIKSNVFWLSVRINDTVTFVDDGLDEDIEFGDDISDDEEADAVDNVRCLKFSPKKKIHILIQFCFFQFQI